MRGGRQRERAHPGGHAPGAGGGDVQRRSQPGRLGVPGHGWYRFKVNLEFYDTAGVGFNINTVRTTVQSSVTNTILLDYDYAVASHVNGSGRTVLQFTSPIYRTLAGGGANVKFVANITDDRGNAMTLSNQASVRRVGGPAEEIE